MTRNTRVPPGTPQQRDRILRATTTLVGKRGIDGVRLRDVAEAVGVSIGTLQHYFTTRDGLLLAAFRHSSDAIVSDIREVMAAQDANPAGAIEALFRAVRDSPRLRQRCIVWLEWAAASSRDQRLRRLINEVYAEWRAALLDAVTTGVDAGLLRPLLPPADAVAILLALIDGFELALVIGVQDTDAASVYRRVLATAGVLLGMPAADTPG